jgi:GTPase
VEPEVSHRAGFVAIGGRSNVGKSTLINRLVGHKVAAVSPKPQTTRRRILGIRSDAAAQVIFIDTPGLHESSRTLNRRMIDTARRSLAEGEVVAGVIEAGDHVTRTDLAFMNEFRSIDRPKILVVNKIDLIPRMRMLPMLEQVTREMPEVEVVPVSAHTGENCDELMRMLIAMLPAGPSLMPEDEYTDQSERALAEEIVREKIFLKLEQEVPFSTAVTVEEFTNDKDLIRIGAVILVDRESHKGIVIGAGGQMLKQIGTAARLELEQIFGSRVFLQLHVKVDTDWTHNPRRLKELGL